MLRLVLFLSLHKDICCGYHKNCFLLRKKVIKLLFDVIIMITFILLDVSEEVTLEEEGLSEKEKQVEEEKDVISDEELLHSKFQLFFKKKNMDESFQDYS